jgi:hypothetical protein
MFTVIFLVVTSAMAIATSITAGYMADKSLSNY